MVTATQAVWLGLIQGLTEFLPVSSSGHLVLGQSLLGIKEPALLFDISVHMGTLLAVLWVFRADFWAMLRGLWAKDDEARQGRRLLFLVVAASIPTGIMGLLFKDDFERLFASPAAVGLALLTTGFFLMATRLIPAGRADLKATGPLRAVIVGLAQGLAITPGLSRSGTTISVGLMLGMERRLAAHFSFVLSVPAVLGALLLHLKDLGPEAQVSMPPLLIGALVACLSGYVALKLLLRIVQAGRLHWFAPYCWALGLTALALSYLG
jgi:undecaprenyl-diphosphatase